MTDHIIELGLLKRRRTDSADTVQKLGRLCDRLLSLISGIAAEAENPNTAEFRSGLEGCRAKFFKVTDLSVLEDTVETCLQLCIDYFRRSREYSLEREEELEQVVDVLRKAVADFSGKSVSFNDSLLESSVRFSRLSSIEDIRELRRRLVEEVGELERAIVERRKQEETAFLQVSGRIDHLQAKLNEAKREASQDWLLQVANRRSFDQMIDDWVRIPERQPFVLAMLDVDEFKRINDTHGHLIGDQVLLCVCKWINNNIRSADFLARYGGDEFAALLSGISLAEAEKKFGSLLEKIAESPFEYKEEKVRAVRVTVSCGLADYIAGDTAEALVGRADSALYEAKKAGKNRLVARSK
jgi:diguanylate cyclase